MMTGVPDVSQLIVQLQQYLRWQQAHGCRGVSCSAQTRQILASWSGPQTARRKKSFVETASAPQESLEQIREDLGECRRCRLHAGRAHIVFGAGSSRARLMFVGEAPGFNEDRQGEPFVGQAGQLLSKIISAMTLSREDVYICNVIKCRPSQNRNPMPDEIAACAPFLQRQIQSVQPEFICALGSFAAQTLLKSQRSISLLRGRFYDYQGIRLIPTFHPAYLLHHPEKKRQVWDDMQLLMEAMGIRR
ncbi:MAG: uracil-DNA glycosylase [Desulfobacterales bacterium]